METVLVIGLGEIGRALFEMIAESNTYDVYGLDLDNKKMQVLDQDQKNIPSAVDIMHICIPFRDDQKFTEIIFNYVKRFKPKLIIVNSTVLPGTTKKIYDRCNCLIAHSPVRGVHENLKHMKWEIKRWTKYVGGINNKAAEETCRHFEKIGMKVKIIGSIESELAKLFETTYRAWMIACFQEMHRISQYFSGKFDSIVDFLEDTHRVRLDRPLMFPGFIGGHCLIPNTKLLLNVYNSEFLKLILISNEKRYLEIQNKSTKLEIEQINKRAKKLQKELIKLIKNQ